VILTGHVDDVAGLLSAADVFALSSRFEGMPNNVLEAMAASLPIAATRVGDVPDMLTDGEDALLVPPDDEGKLSAALSRLLTEAPLSGRLAAAARRRAETVYPVGAMVEKTAESLSRAARA
jgi:glycosyltransferase involved in cell wall biosynthesis